MTEYRVSLGAAITFSNGGDLTAHGFRIDLPSPDVGEAEIAALFIASLGLLMTDSVELSNVHVFAEPHKGNAGRSLRSPPGPGDHDRTARRTQPYHPSRHDHLRSGHRVRHRPAHPDRQYTGTYLDGADLSAISLEQTVDLPAVIVRVTGAPHHGIDVGALAALDVHDTAVLLHTGDDARYGTPACSENRRFLTRAGATWLVDHGAALVGIDALNIDDTADNQRPAHTLLLAAGIPVVENLTGLDQLPPTGAHFTALPLRIEATGTIPVRAFARLPE